MPSKKKYNSRFPPARIKKIMQTDEDIGKVAAAVPVLISKCLEMFLASLLTKAGDVTKSKQAKTMSQRHLKECIMTEPIFDFLKDHVAHIPDIQGDEEAQSSTSFPIEFVDPAKVTRKRSIAKQRKTAKKRLKTGHRNQSGEESDSPDDPNENGSGNDSNDVTVSTSSRTTSTVMSEPIELESERFISFDETKLKAGAISEKKPSIHIPLDMLMSNTEIQTPLKLEKETAKQEDQSKGLAGQHKTLKQTPAIDSTTESGILPTTGKQSSPARKGVIVPNTSAYPPPMPSIPSSSTPNIANVVDQTSLTSTQDVSGTSVNTSDKPMKDLRYPKYRGASRQDGLPNMDPQPGSMLSLLYSSSVPISLSPGPSLSTVQQAPSAPAPEKYAYSPLTQHHFSELRQPLLYPGLPPGTNGAQGSLGLRYQFPPYAPATTQRHYLGYPQAMLTPPGQPLASLDAQMAMQSAMAQVKPKSRNRSDDEDYDM